MSVPTSNNADRNSGIAFGATILAQIIFAIAHAVIESKQSSFIVGIAIIAFVGAIITSEIYVRSLRQEISNRPMWLPGRIIVIAIMTFLLAATLLFDAGNAPRIWMIRIGALDLLSLLIAITARPLLMTKRQHY